MPDRLVYPSWETAMHAIPARSYFYHLLPAAIGSAQVESLSSYLIRLAEAHDVSPGILVNKELLPRVRETFRRHPYRVGKSESTFVYVSHTLNRVGQCAHDWASVLEDLTGVREIRWLTMITWSQILSETGLLRRHPAWCPHCLEDRRRTNHPVYHSLLWSIAQVLVCPVHDTILEQRCPHCEREQHALSARSRPGHCCRCRRWLGKTGVVQVTSERHRG